ncbi:trimeric intracellular cation channel family protein [Winogradskyella psychrotolerans]|uniref:trimeric intracellular cation channel family protein n=1 Tax=Winogradskyella psychrotolerans TaxID=1344585 RepID=UPI001C06A258|nr:trimeric intracellular cation channel family protein [Winogradskyella psychrotolerans]MBU2919925.1 trimeric intracellular cation channel family protein [Winogradskyella psychrotolerans]
MFFQFTDILGTIAFAISGALIAMNKRMDPFGVLIIAFVTAVGGGTLRDVMIGIEPVSWMRNMTFVYVIIGSAAFAVVFRKRISYLRKSLFLFDTIGIALYTVVGVETGLVAGLHPLICIAMGTMTACFGGVLRDILCNEIPVVFRKEIYATACILGGLTYFLLLQFFEDRNYLFVIAGLVVIIVRLIAVRYKISLPTLYKKDEDIL